jgi:hypothetical protein
MISVWSIQASAITILTKPNNLIVSPTVKTSMTTNGIKIANRRMPIYVISTFITRNMLKKQHKVHLYHNIGWIDRFAKVTIVLLAAFAYKALTATASE